MRGLRSAVGSGRTLSEPICYKLQTWRNLVVKKRCNRRFHRGFSLSIQALVIFTCVFLFSGCEKQTSVQLSGKTVKVGFIGPFTGATAVQGRESIKGVRTAMHMHSLLDNGDAVELVVENDNNDPELMEKALQKMLEEHQVAAILLASSSNAALKAASVADEGEIPVIALLATHPGVVGKSQFVSQLCFDDKFQGAVAALFVADELLIEKVAVFTNQNDVYSINLGAEFARKYESVGGKIIEQVSLGDVGNDLDQTLENLQKKGTELLYLPISAKYVVQIVKATEATGWSPELMGSDGMLASVQNSFPDDLDRLNGIYATDFFSTDKERIISSHFGGRAEKSYDSLFQGIPSSYTALGVEGYAILFDAMNRCEDTNERICINQMIRSTRHFEGFMGKVSIQPDGKAVRALFVNRISGGELNTVVKVY